ncbi:hypothetical protein C8N35_10172 [Breoghania corrubedonensis]|uniref:Uncharacterized protein n=1 Tax=Breoghania corrubedonensis TaxID=665038 RepID=A0A2T5VE54_9HYPH|nr:hypothetical protein C8N35_10172 [Breoghania corrubedonensis]
MPRTRPRLRLLPPLLGLMLLAGCQTTATRTFETDVSDACGGVLQPIRYSRNDTRETRRQIAGLNAAIESLCGDARNE